MYPRCLGTGCRLTLQIDHNHVLDRSTRGEPSAQESEPVRGRDEHSGTAIADDVGSLVSLQDVIDRDEHPGCGGCAENGCHCLNPLIQIDSDPIVLQQSETGKTC